MKQLFQKLNSLKVLAFFFDSPYAESYLRNISRRLDMNPSTVSRCLAFLEKEGLLIRRTEKNATFFKAGMGSGFKALKVAYTLAKMEDAGIVEFFREKSSGISSLLLYGSSARGEDDADSDYDFLVIAAESAVSKASLNEKLGRETSIKRYTIGGWKGISKQNRAFYLEVISDSIALFGQKPVID